MFLLIVKNNNPIALTLTINVIVKKQDLRQLFALSRLPADSIINRLLVFFTPSLPNSFTKTKVHFLRFSNYLLI